MLIPHLLNEYLVVKEANMKIGNNMIEKLVIVTLACTLAMIVVVSIATKTFSQAESDSVYLPLISNGGGSTPATDPTPQVTLTPVQTPTGTVDPTQVPTPTATESMQERAAAVRSSIWDNTTIEVCWDTPGFDEQKSWTQGAIARTWAKESALSFIGWEDCVTNNQGIRITVNDEGPHVKALGRFLNGLVGGMVLNFTFSNWSSFCADPQNNKLCIESIAVHEFGHAIGLAHEQNREDAPDWCREQAQGTAPDWLVTAYDMDSIMNYCNEDWNNAGLLSELDIEAVRLLYGDPDPKRIARVWFHESTDSGFEYMSNLQTLAGFWNGQKWLAGDFNGDNKQDLVNIYGNANGKTRVWLHLSNGTSFVYQVNLQTMAGFWDSQKWLVGDFNGDERDDLVNVYGNEENKARVWLHLSTGTGFEFQSSLQTMADFADSQKWLAGDFNGDGRDDLVNVYGNEENNIIDPRNKTTC
jgi:hypothetical protein